MRIKRNQERMIIAGRALQQVRAEEGVEFLNQVRSDLQRSGVDEKLSSRIATQLCEQHCRDELSAEQYGAMIHGASLACGVQCGTENTSQANFGRVREIERMMQAFAGELAKLDESLEVLVTYVQRMRQHSVPDLAMRVNETLH
jgi:hypothetical protein